MVRKIGMTCNNTEGQSIRSSQWAVMHSWQDSYISKMTYKPSKLGQTDLVFSLDQSSSAGLCMQDYKSLHTAVMICATLVNTHTDRHRDRQRLTSYTINSASCNIFLLPQNFPSSIDIRALCQQLSWETSFSFLTKPLLYFEII